MRAHQGHLNDPLRAHGDAPITVTGICDARTVRKPALAAWFLDGVKVDAALFLHADGVNDPGAGGFQFGFPVTEANKKLVANLRQEFLSLPGHPKSRNDSSTADARQYFGFKRVKSPFKVLVEHGFLTNPTERQWLKAKVANLARAEYEALCRTFAMTPAAALVEPRPRRLEQVSRRARGRGACG